MPEPAGGPAPDVVVRSALELAVEVARVGARAVPAIESPRGLRPFLRFARLPDRALGPVRRAIEDDESFRTRVAEVAGQLEDELGRAGFLFLVRPDGWEHELADLVEAADAVAAADRDEREQREAVRRVAQEQAATRRAEQAEAAARAEADRAVAALADERRLRRVAEGEARGLADRVAALESAVESATGLVADAVRERDAVRSRLADLEAELAAHDAAAAAGPRASPPENPDVTAAMARARAAAATLWEALDEAGQALGPVGAAEPTGARRVAGRPAGRPSPLEPAGPVGPAGGRRRPARLPPAVFDDSPEAAVHLVRVPGALLLVDGYNAAMALWPTLGVTEVRERLVDALRELSARTGVAVHVVFDGADLGGAAPPPTTARSPVRISFSPPEVEADDVILELLAARPPTQPVVVASSDRRVRDGASELGANVLSSAQLGAALGR